MAVGGSHRGIASGGYASSLVGLNVLKRRSADRSMRQWSMNCPRLIARACSWRLAISDLSSSSVICE
jgi:hypothetical protein